MSSIPDVEIKHLKRRPDERGFFTEVARVREWRVDFVQMNHSHSRAGVLRGLHYHQNQADLWYVVRGTAQVALADLREGPGSRRVELFTVDDRDSCAIYIPPGVAHGYLALTPVDLLYWVTEYYDSTDEYGVAWNDPSLGLKWASDQPIVSERDRANPRLDG